MHKTGRHAAPERFPKVSILVPARNEEANIERCARSLLLQDYPDFEVLILDDASTDRTPMILDTLADHEPRLRVLKGQPLEEGWLGKNWACAQLASQAAGELLFFTDADTFHRPNALRALVTAIEGEQADLVSGFPHQEMQSWGEKLLVPFFSWVLLCFVPLGVGYRIKFPALACAVGQMLVFRRAVYEAIGGHAAVRASIAEDLALARRISACGYRWRMMRAARLISCRMYSSGSKAFAGLAKNLFAAFSFRLLPYGFAWGWLLVMFFKPWYDLAAYTMGVSLQVPLIAVLACIGLALVMWLIPYFQLGLPLLLAALYPVTLVAIETVALRSLWLSISGGLAWKGRSLDRPRIRLW